MSQVDPNALIGSAVYLKKPIKMENWIISGDFWEDVGLDIGHELRVIGYHNGKYMVTTMVHVDENKGISPFQNVKPRYIQFLVSEKQIADLDIEKEVRIIYKVNGKEFDSIKDAITSKSL